jgi:pimeloyl-ACP methyl ester carboxylesterase
MSQFALNDGTGFVMNYEVHPGMVPRTTLFIHGNLASNRWWYPAQEIWQQKARGQNFAGSLIYAEFRGCGKSTVPRNESEVDMHRFADDFIALVRSLNLGKINLVGHSTGGFIVSLMLAKAPELFSRALLLDPVGPRGVQFDKAMIAAFEQMKVDKDMVAVVLGSTIYKNDPQSEFFQSVIVEDAFSAVKAVGHLVVKALDGLDIRKEVSQVAHPVLVAHGEFDKLLDVEASREMSTVLQNAKFLIIEGQGHCTNVEAPEKFVSIAQEFLFSSQV